MSRSCLGTTVTVIVIAMAMATACSNGGGPSATADGVLTGTVTGEGGPLIVQGTSTHEAVPPGTPQRGTPVSATSTGGQRFSTTTDAKGSYRLRLPPGSYAIDTGCGPGGSQSPVVVQAGDTVTRNISCPIP
ncbi:MAG TPA: carboxypeptidase-like regulatory domain-containing protein [Mycobacteriales bacterium]|nr:carboxypeptidase-like regulatory domain-containing protein [Mycobacteriales bacterium]